MRYEHKVYGEGYAFTCKPEKREDGTPYGVDILHYLITGYLLGGRSLDGVEITPLEDKEYGKVGRRRAKALAFSMKQVGR